MQTYSETVLLQNAEDLLRQANSIIAICAAKYGGIAFFAALLGLSALQYVSRGNFQVGLSSLGIGLLGVVAGIVEGRRLSFNLRLEAQKVLALIEIEHNTRRVGQ